jgi:hypothetical protein
MPDVKQLAIAASGRAFDLGIREVFSINQFACAHAAEAIRAYSPTIEQTAWGKLPSGAQLTFKLAVVAICHQMNWDSLQDRLAGHLLSSSETQMAESLATLRAPKLEEWLAGYHKPGRLRVRERAALLRNLGSQLKLEFGGKASELVGKAGRRINGESGFLAQLNRFNAFRVDPVRKKSNVLIQDIVRERIVTFDDEDKLQPAIDYHLMRLYLRSGRVVPCYDEVADAIKRHPRPRGRLITLLRTTVAEALKLTAFYAGLSVPNVNYLEWQIGRSVCARTKPFCLREARPTDLDDDIAILFENQCPYIRFCPAYSDPEWRNLQEPQFRSTFY